ERGRAVAAPVPLEPRLLPLADLVAELGIERAPLLGGIAREVQHHGEVLAVGLEPRPLHALVAQLDPGEPLARDLLSRRGEQRRGHGCVVGEEAAGRREQGSVPAALAEERQHPAYASRLLGQPVAGGYAIGANGQFHPRAELAEVRMRTPLHVAVPRFAIDRGIGADPQALAHAPCAAERKTTPIRGFT